MTVAQAFMGETVDHLIPECPALVRSKAPDVGRPTIDLVDVDGSDLCGWCVRVWKARNHG